MTQADQPSGRRGLRWALIVLGLAMIWLFAAVAPSPFALEKPGPVVDALGEILIDGELTPVVGIDGIETFPTTGALNVLSVSLYGTPDSHMSWLQVGLALFDPSVKIVPMSELYPEGATVEDHSQSAAMMMSRSQYSAVAAALHELDIDVEEYLTVSSVSADGPSAGILKIGDVIRTLGGAEVSTIEDLRSALTGSLTSGEAVVVGINRDEEPISVEVTPAPMEAGGDPLLGITISSEFEFPFDVKLNLGDIGGPSAGTMFALAVYDSLTPGGLTGDLDISGTGTIDADGNVGAIGGLEQKMWGASRAGTDLFLMPIENCADVPASIPRSIRIAPVATLAEAIEAIETAANGDDPPGLERCPATANVRSAG